MIYQKKLVKKKIIEALKNKGMSRNDLCYETNLWGDYFFDAFGNRDGF